MTKRAALTASALALATASASNAQAQYDVTDLGSLHSIDTVLANAINDHGDIVGSSDITPFLWTEKTGMVALPLPEGAFFANAIAVSKHGDVGIYTFNEDGTISSFLYAKGTLTRLPGEEQILGVNKRLHAVARAGFGESLTGFFWDGTAWTPVGTEARGLNDRDQVIGYRTITSPTLSNQAFLWSDGTYLDLGTLGGRDSLANAISSQGVIVGVSTVAGVSDGHGFRWENGSMIDLGCLAGATFCEALGVNDEGDVVVGTAQFPGDDDLGHPSFAHAFAWRDGTIQDLNALIDPASGWTLEKATAVNESGQIVGQGRVGNSLHSFLLTPR